MIRKMTNEAWDAALAVVGSVLCMVDVLAGAEPPEPGYGDETPMRRFWK